MSTSNPTKTDHTKQYLKTTAFFGQVNKNITSPQFKGGKITNIFGETRLDFTHSDILGHVVLDISQAFGEVHLTVPPSWQVRTELSQFLAKTRDNTTKENGNKVLQLTGNSVFATLSIHNSGSK
jgi:predicted membrane protein